MYGTSSARIELLNKSNYDTWKLQMQALLIKADLWEYVSGDTTKPEPGVDNANARIVSEWVKNDLKAKSDIILSISVSELKQIKNCVTSRATWLKRQEIYESRGPARNATLLKQLTQHRMTEDSEVRDHLNIFFDTVDKLASMDIDINPDLLTIMLLYSLPSSFENFRCAIESRDALPEPEALRTKIIEESDARKSSSRENASDAMFVNKMSVRSQIEHDEHGGKANLHQIRIRIRFYLLIFFKLSLSMNILSIKGKKTVYV